MQPRLRVFAFHKEGAHVTCIRVTLTYVECLGRFEEQLFVLALDSDLDPLSPATMLRNCEFPCTMFWQALHDSESSVNAAYALKMFLHLQETEHVRKLRQAMLGRKHALAQHSGGASCQQAGTCPNHQLYPSTADVSPLWLRADDYQVLTSTACNGRLCRCGRHAVARDPDVSHLTGASDCSAPERKRLSRKREQQHLSNLQLF